MYVVRTLLLTCIFFLYIFLLRGILAGSKTGTRIIPPTLVCGSADVELEHGEVRQAGTPSLPGVSSLPAHKILRHCLRELQIEDSQNPEWADGYVDYAGLKRTLAEMIECGHNQVRRRYRGMRDCARC